MVRITKEMLKKVKGMKHGEQILQHYKLYKFYSTTRKDKTKADQNKKAFLKLSGLRDKYGFPLK